MDAERVRTIARKLPHVEETVQWGETLVFWVGDKAVGGKMFALVSLDNDGGPVMSFSAGVERYSELLENDSMIPAPYMARIYWVALARWTALGDRELAALLADAHALTYAKLSRRTKDVLALPAAERRKLVREHRRVLAAAKMQADAAKRASPARQGVAK